MSTALTTIPYQEPRECRPHPYALFLQDPLLCCSSIYAYVFPVDFFRPAFCSFLLFHLPTYWKLWGTAKSKYSVRLPSIGSNFNDSSSHKITACLCLSPDTECFDRGLPQFLYPHDDTVSQVTPRRLVVASSLIHCLQLMKRFSVATDGQARRKPECVHFINLCSRARPKAQCEWVARQNLT